MGLLYLIKILPCLFLANYFLLGSQALGISQHEMEKRDFNKSLRYVALAPALSLLNGCPGQSTSPLGFNVTDGVIMEMDIAVTILSVRLES